LEHIQKRTATLSKSLVDCDMYQGYLFSGLIEAKEEVLPLLEQKRR